MLVLFQPKKSQFLKLTVWSTIKNQQDYIMLYAFQNIFALDFAIVPCYEIVTPYVMFKHVLQLIL